MKAIKKMLSLVLVAMLLVSAVPFQASATGDEAYTVQVIVYNYSDDSRIASWTEDWTVTEAEAKNGTGFFDAETAAEVLDGTEYGNAEKYTPVSVIAQVSGTSLVYKVYVKPVTTTTVDPEEDEKPEDDGEPEVTPEGEAKPDGEVKKVTLTIDYNLSGYENETHTTTVGTLYKNFVGVPARGGYDFLGWFSTYYNRIIDVTKDPILGDDTISGQWSAAKQYTLTLDENRGAEESVNYGKKVTYGAAIGKLPTPEREGYVFAGWKLNGKIITAETIWDLQGDGTAYAQWKLESDTEGEAMNGNGNHTADGKVYLEVYINGDTAKMIKRVDITDYAKDNKITLAEAKKVASKYVTAKSGYTLSYELFSEESWWWYTRDEETNGSDSVIVNRDGDDYVYVMVKNVKKAVADDSNPKTGDNIMMAFSVMTMSAASLAAVFFLNKKRLVK